MRLFLIFLALPLIEIALFIQVGELIGLWPTLGLVLLAALAGIVIIRLQGFHTLGRLRARIEAGEDPSGPLADAAMVLFAGILLLVPGFFTDAVAILLLIPPVRALLYRRAAGRFTATIYAAGRASHGSPRRRPAPQTIEGDYEVLDDVPPAQRGASGWTRPRS